MTSEDLALLFRHKLAACGLSSMAGLQQLSDRTHIPIRELKRIVRGEGCAQVARYCSALEAMGQKVIITDDPAVRVLYVPGATEDMRK